MSPIPYGPTTRASAAADARIRPCARLGFVAVVVLVASACHSGARPSAAPPSGRAPGAVSVPVSARTMAPAAPVATACDAVLAGLPFGKSAHRADAYLINERDERLPIAGAMPSLAPLGMRLLSATAVALGGDSSARLVFLAPVTAKEDRHDRGTFESVERGFARCVEGKGYELFGPPAHVARDVLPSIIDVEALSLPNGDRAVSVTQELTGAEYTHEVLVLGAGSRAFPVLEPAGASAGVIARVGVVEEGHVVGHAFVRTLNLDAAGWYPLAGGLAYVQVLRRGDEVRASVRARLGSDGVTEARAAARAAAPRVTWMLVGSGAPPASCAPPARARCRTLSVPQASIEPAITWMAGAFDDRHSALAARAELRAPKSARWLAVDAPSGARTITGPDGAPALVTLGVTEHPAPPAPPPPLDLR